MTSSKILFYLCLSFIAGIFINSLVKIPQMFVWGFFVLGIVTIFVSFLINKNLGIIIGFCVLIVVLGIIRFQISQFVIENNELKKFNDLPAQAGSPEKITLMGKITAEPDIRTSMQKLKVTTEKIIVGNQKLSIGGDVLITTNAMEEYHYLDKMEMVGKLKTPAVFEDFNYKDYLLKDGIYSVMDYPKITTTSTKHEYNLTTFIYEKILFVKSALVASIDKSLPTPHSFILSGMVFGNDKSMPKELKDQFNATGLSHVTAVSGSNIVILISLVMAILLMMGFWRGQAFYGSVGFIAIYIILIGLPASGVRAAIMGCIALLAQKLGRQNTSARVLVIAAVLMLLQNPLLLYYDVGFQLSFLASLGIIYIKPLLDILFATVARGHLKGLADLVSITFAAQIITLPIIVYNFGTLSVIAPISNLLALPVVEALTVLGFFLSIIGAILPIAGFIIAIPCWLLLMYFIKVLDIFSQPWATVTVPNVWWIWPVLYYIVLGAIIHMLQKYQRPKFLGY